VDDPRLASLARNKLGQETTRHLREALLTGRYAAGDRMAVEELARMFGVSTMPVREALLTLANEGLLEVLPRRGFRVMPLKLRDIDDAFRVHALVAGLLAEEAAALIDPAGIAGLWAIQQAIEQAFETEEDRHELASRVEDLNFQFHRAINHVPDAKRLRWFLRAANRYVPRRFYETVAGWNEATRERHPAIIEALEARDGARARALMEEHVTEAGRLVRRHQEESGLVNE
jgi:DNA-binding GntR family transcriptional regulator